MKSWPSNLPEILVSGYSEGRRFSKKMFEPEQGGPIERRASYKVRSMDTWSIIVDQFQLAQFEDFVELDLEGAIQPFQVNHPRKRQLCTVRLIGEEPYIVSALGAHIYSVQMNVEVT